MQETRRSNIARTIYPLRAVGYLLALASVLFHQLQKSSELETFVWIFGAIYIVYPHVAFLYARKAQDHRKAEMNNLIIDKALIASICFGLDFNLMSATPFLLSNSATNYSVGGLKVFLKGWGLWAVTTVALLLLWQTKPAFFSVENIGAFIPSILYLFAATHYIAMVAFHRGTTVIKVKRQIQEQNMSLKEQKEELLVLNEEIRQQNEEIIAQRDHIEEQHSIIQKNNDDVKASILYARRIQHAMLPTAEALHSYFEDVFVMFKPRDVVSGDFYWVSEKNYKVIVVVGDCTGHGVPGALMSMIGCEMLNDIVKRRNITEPDKILEVLQKGIFLALRQDESENKDGMDVAVCSIDNYPIEYQEHIGTPKLEFSGACSPLVYMQNNELHLIKGDRIGIGGARSYQENQKFQKHVIDISQPTTVYMFSDGYQDQFGGENRRKFSSKRFREKLFQLHALPMEQQSQELEISIQDWMHVTDEKQIDDMLVMGIKVS